MQGLLDHIYTCAFRCKFLSSDVARSARIPLRWLIQQRIVKQPPTLDYFIPEVHRGVAQEVLGGSLPTIASQAPNEHLKNSLSLMSTDWSHLTRHQRGDVFERMFISWMMAMRSHQACRTFVLDARIRADGDAISTKRRYLRGKQPQAQAPHQRAIDSLPKGSLAVTHNGVTPLCHPDARDEPFILHQRYRILQMPGKYCPGRPCTSSLSDLQLEDLLLGNCALRNVECGAGFDFCIADWVPDDGGGFRIVLSFIEMRFSHSLSLHRQGLPDIHRKHKLVEHEFGQIVRRLPVTPGVRYDFRLVMECFRDLADAPYDAHTLPPKTFVFDRSALTRSFGPTIANSVNFYP